MDFGCRVLGGRGVSGPHVIPTAASELCSPLSGLGLRVATLPGQLRTS